MSRDRQAIDAERRKYEQTPSKPGRSVTPPCPCRRCGTLFRPKRPKEAVCPTCVRVVQGQKVEVVSPRKMRDYSNEALLDRMVGLQEYESPTIDIKTGSIKRDVK